MSQSLMARVPVLRILLPLVAGILMQQLWHCTWAPIALIIMAIASCAWLSLNGRKSPTRRLQYRPYYIIPLSTVAFSLGWLAAIAHSPAHLSAAQASGRTLTGRIHHLEYTDFSMRMTIDVLDRDLPPCRVLVTTRGCDYTAMAGDVVTWPAALREVTTAGNPDETDYARLMLHNEGIRYEQHLPVAQVKKTGFSPTLVTRMANVRRSWASLVFDTELRPGSKGFVLALLLGENQLIDKVTRERFSAAGIAHVLALSGLHVGIITLLIYWLLFPLDYLRLKKLRLAITLGFMILFAVFTGLSPSVVRATVMTGFVFASLIFYRRSTSLNALATAALIILVFSPSALYSVGFQLSFITVGSLLLLARVPEWLQSGNRVLNYFIAMATTSLIATLSTLALSAHYFHTVSLMSIAGNLLVLPILPIFMVLAALFLLVTAAGMQWTVLDWSVDACYRYIHTVARLIEATPLSHVDGVYVSAMGVIFYFIIMGLLILWFYRHKPLFLLLAGGTLAVALAHSAWLDWHAPHRGTVIFNDFTSTPVLCYDWGKACVWIPDVEEADLADFSRRHAKFLARRNITRLTLIASDTTCRMGDAVFQPPHAWLMGRHMLAIDRLKGKKYPANTRGGAVDDILLTKRYRGSIHQIAEHYQFKQLIISGSLEADEARLLVAQCDSMGVKVHDLSRQGAYMTEQ